MLVALKTNEGTVRIPSALLQAIVQNARRQADLTAATLDATGLFPDRPTRLPAGYLLEFGALIQLYIWETEGLRESLADFGLPTFKEAPAALAARAAKGFTGFEGTDVTPLSRQMLDCWIEHFAWDGHEYLQADVVVGDVNEDRFADSLADFIWEHRRELSTILKPSSIANRQEAS